MFSAREGVEAQSETVWRQADRYNVPRIVFINKMDREGADFRGGLQRHRSHDWVAIRWRSNCPSDKDRRTSHNPFRGVIDLIDMKMLQFDPADRGQGSQRNRRARGA